MSTLLLDDIGLSLLAQLNEAWDANETHGSTMSVHDYIVTSTNDLWRLDAEYAALAQEFVNHLVFIYANRAYWPRLTIVLSSDINIGVELRDNDGPSRNWYIARKCVGAYKRYQKGER